MISKTDNTRPFLDVLFCCLAVLIVIISLLHDSKKKADNPSPPQNAIYQVIMTWDDMSKSDIDLWGEDPNGNKVGFKRREGGDNCLMSLARDDLGNRGDYVEPDKNINKNFEVISIRGLVEGEYIFNCHFYAKKDDISATKVRAKLVKVKPAADIVEKEVVLFSDGDEQTFFRFSIDKDGNVVDINDLPKQIANK